ncbi:protein FAM210B, mitochondrial [Centropristis striata]|uniref:protein FAM210B, mitochondrial n=1 Tax=Centropristis striata TaxID=184440 RepID=UPI0027E12C79|nr:protein FAM210B, mitochondrial [Centropristis striata]
MFLCRTGRLSAAARDQAFKSAGSFLVHVKANTPRDVTLTLRKDYTFQRLRCLCLSVDATLVHLGKQQPDLQPGHNRDLSCALDWGHFDRAATIAVSKRVHSKGSYTDIISQPLVFAKRRHSSSRESVGNGLFTGLSSPLSSTGTMQTRSFSTKKSDAGEEQTANNKESELNVKEASTASSSTVETEPEGAKPNKTQQLKKVFKEYGAVGVCFHIGISLMSLGMFYLLVSSGIDMAAVLCKVGFSEEIVRSKMAAGTSTFVLAYAIHKLFAPVRISTTLVSVPLIVRYFRKTGLFKPPTPAP